jgi:hypothetical protein
MIRASDVARLRAWASASNPVYAEGLAALARTARRKMDTGVVPREDKGSTAYDEYPTELYAELFAFMSLVDPNAAARGDWGRRARTLLMAVIAQAEKGPRAGRPFRDPSFSISDRSRWQGEAFGLTVDWAYHYFSAQDKERIRNVFLRWAAEQYKAYPLNQFSGPLPSPRGKTNDPALVRDRVRVRWSLNNYYIAHARNLGLMAMALDPRDDPGNALGSQLASVTGQWLYVIDGGLRDNARGGLSPEGFEYGPDAFGRLAQLITALRTSGQEAKKIEAAPAWGNLIPAYLHSLPWSPTTLQGDESYRGQLWQAASFGDEQNAWMPDPIGVLGPLALDAMARGDAETVEAVRWIETNVPEGGKEKLLDRIGNTDQFFSSILYFMIFDPKARTPADPRRKLATRYFASGINRTIARTCWCRDGRMFVHILSFNTTDHQIANGNDFGFNRKGEWLTKNRSQYESVYTDYTNSITIGNDAPSRNAPDDYRHTIFERGSQYILAPSGDPTLVARSSGHGYVYITGDATRLYNSAREGVSGVKHASRSIVWLEPDVIVVYDRAATRSKGKFKRFWLQLPAAAAISRNRATVRTPRGQQLFFTTLLPKGAKITSAPDEEGVGEPAVGTPMTHRLRVEAPGDPRSVRFLHVLQGADGGASADPATLLRSLSGTRFEGALVAGTAVLFPVKLGIVQGTVMRIPATGLRRVLVTGLEPGRSYSASLSSGRLTLNPGGEKKADRGGLLVVAP